MITAQMVKELRTTTGAGMLDCKKALTETEGNMEEAINWLREKGMSKAAKKASRIAAEGLGTVVANDTKAVILEINSETDFVAKNEKFINLVNFVGETILNSEVTTMEEALVLETTDGTLADTMNANTATIGEKLSFRRFSVLTKDADETFGSYMHMGGRIVVLVKLKGANEEVAKDVAMHAAAMSPKYVRRDQVPTDEVEKEREVLKAQAIEEGKPAEIAEKMVAGRINKYYKEICLEEQPFVKDGDVTVSKYLENNNGEILEMIRFEVGEGIEKKEENFAEEVMNQING